MVHFLGTTPLATIGSFIDLDGKQFLCDSERGTWYLPDRPGLRYREWFHVQLL